MRRGICTLAILFLATVAFANATPLGIMVPAYFYTGTLWNSVSNAVQTDIGRYFSFYSVNGIFLD